MAILIILSILVVVGFILWVTDGRKKATDDRSSNPDTTNGEECCGMHITCEKDSLLAAVSDRIIYYEDEELDRHAHRDPSTYTEDETEEFRDILLTLRPEEIAGWGRSLQLRGIELPGAVRDELLMIVAEARKTAQ